MRNLFVPAIIALSLAACSTTPTQTTTTQPAPQTTSGGPEVVTPQPRKETPPKPMAQEEIDWANLVKDPGNILSKRSVYFDLDKYDIKPQYQPLVEAHGKLLATASDAKMLIQGNADERGSREYNLALGQKRAEAVKQAVILLGAKEKQVEAVSFGKERPKAEGHNEAAWAENRRSDILYDGEF